MSDKGQRGGTSDPADTTPESRAQTRRLQMLFFTASGLLCITLLLLFFVERSTNPLPTPSANLTENLSENVTRGGP